MNFAWMKIFKRSFRFKIVPFSRLYVVADPGCIYDLRKYLMNIIKSIKSLNKSAYFKEKILNMLELGMFQRFIYQVFERITTTAYIL